ncbi:hypothetical protein TcasGA2_TC012263 [Tribolium castaneum]|uniref:Uncharacterized protein n=1 Tax=Tribolium castaneum TaxID=7070 RepID=D6X084_TRICA|nr:hypothetical protein TcasGA2_TC012263 [Tribolium castaneum]
MIRVRTPDLRVVRGAYTTGPPGPQLSAMTSAHHPVIPSLEDDGNLSMHLAGLIEQRRNGDGKLHFRHGTGRRPDQSVLGIRSDN